VRNAVANPQEPGNTKGHDDLGDDTRMTMLQPEQGHTAATSPTHTIVSTSIRQGPAQRNTRVDDEVPESDDRLPRAPPHEELEPYICERAQRASAPDEVLPTRWKSLQEYSNYKTHDNNSATTTTHHD